MDGQRQRKERRGKAEVKLTASQALMFARGVRVWVDLRDMPHMQRISISGIDRRDSQKR